MRVNEKRMQTKEKRFSVLVSGGSADVISPSVAIPNEAKTEALLVPPSSRAHGVLFFFLSFSGPRLVCSGPIVEPFDTGTPFLFGQPRGQATLPRPSQHLQQTHSAGREQL